MEIKNIALVFGGKSSEHDVSIKSFETIYEAIKESNRLSTKLKEIFYIKRDGTVFKSCIDFDKDFKNYIKDETNCTLAQMFEILSKNDLFLYSTIHGQYGEDGSMQGVCKFFGIDSNLGTILSTSLSMSKYHLNQYLQGKIKNLLIPKSKQIESMNKFDLDDFLDKEIIVKPNSLGSSLFTEKFFCKKNNLSDIKNLCKKILKFDNKVLIQEFIIGKEFSCGCLEKVGKNIVFPLVQIISKDEFFSHNAKYTKGISSNKVIDLNSENDLHKKIKDISLNIFNTLEYHCMSRFDFIVNSENEIYFLEANTLPGLKYSSIYPSMIKEYGYSLEDLIVISIENELNRESKDTVCVYDVE